MPQAIGELLPIAVAFALSSVPIMATLFILLSPNRSRTAVPFLIGWLTGLVLVVVICTLLAQAVPTTRSPRRPDTVLGAVEILVGLAIVVLGVVEFRRGRREPGGGTPKWLETVGSLGRWPSFGLAVLLNVRPKALLLAIAAGLVIRGAGLEVTESVVAIAIYAAIAGSTVAAPIIATLAAPERMEPRLRDAQAWMGRNGSTVTALILVVIGVAVIGSGIGRL